MTLLTRQGAGRAAGDFTNGGDPDTVDATSAKAYRGSGCVGNADLQRDPRTRS